MEPIEVQLEGIPPCLWCGDPVTSPSMDGPLVCGNCDCGVNKETHQKWTATEYDARRKHFSDSIEKYLKLHNERKAEAELKGPPTPAYLVGVSPDRWELRDALPLLPEKPPEPGWVVMVNRQHRYVFAAGSREACEAAARLQHRFINGSVGFMSLAKEIWL